MSLFDHSQTAMQLAFTFELKSVLLALTPKLQEYQTNGENFTLYVDYAKIPFEGKDGFVTVIRIDDVTHFCAPVLADAESAHNFGEAIAKGIFEVAGEVMGLELMASFDQNEMN